MESLNLAYSNLRPENIFLDRNRLKLSDFDCTAEIGTNYKVCIALYSRILNRGKSDQKEYRTFGFFGSRTEQFVFGSLYYLINYGFEIYSDRCLTEDSYKYSSKIVELLQNIEFPKLDSNSLIDDIINKYWYNRYIKVSDLAADTKIFLIEKTDTIENNINTILVQTISNGQ